MLTSDRARVSFPRISGVLDLFAAPSLCCVRRGKGCGAIERLPVYFRMDRMETEFRRVVGAAVPGHAGQQRLTAAQWRQLCIEDHNHGRYRQAVDGYQSYLRLKPDDATIWCNLGAALRKLKHYQSAVNCYRRALELAPNDLTTIGNLANALKDLHRLDEAILLHQQVVAAKPGDSRSRINYACALREAGRFDEALTQLDEAKRAAPHDAGVEWERSQNLLHLGRYREGWAAYEARWRTGDLPVRDYGCARWSGEDISGRTILLHGFCFRKSCRNGARFQAAHFSAYPMSKG